MRRRRAAGAAGLPRLLSAWTVGQKAQNQVAGASRRDGEAFRRCLQKRHSPSLSGTLILDDRALQKAV